MSHDHDHHHSDAAHTAAADAPRAGKRARTDRLRRRHGCSRAGAGWPPPTPRAWSTATSSPRTC